MTVLTNYQDQIKDGEMMGQLICMAVMKNACKILIEKPEGKKLLIDLGSIERMIILKMVLGKQDERV